MTSSRTGNPRHTWAWTKLARQRIAIAATNNEPCCRCGQAIDYTLDGRTRLGPTTDHLHPLAHGGTLLPTLDQLAPAHRHCNSRHGARIGNAKRGDGRRRRRDGQAGMEPPPQVETAASGLHGPPGGAPFSLYQHESTPPSFHVHIPRGVYPWLDALGPPPESARPPAEATVVHPAAAGSYGIDAARWVAAEMRLELRWWQRFTLARMLEHDSEGRLLWTYVINSTPRRAGKSVLVRALALWRVAHPDLLGEAQTVLFTGKDLPICKEIHSSAWAWAAARGWRVARGMGNECITAEDGSRWLVRSQNGVYGYPAGLGICDESWKVPDAVIREGLQPALMERPNPQLLLTSTAHTRATALMRRRISQARAQLTDPGDTLLLLWAADPSADPSDPGAWRDASPHWDEARARLTADAWRDVVSGEAVPDPDEPDLVEGFRAQYLNVWPDPGRSAGVGLVDEGLWRRLLYEFAPGRVLGVGVEAERGRPPVVAVVSECGSGLLLSVEQCGSVSDAVGRCAGLGVAPQVGASLLHDPRWEPLGAVKCQGTARDLGGVFAGLCRDGVVVHDGGTVLDRVVRGWVDRPGIRADAVKAAVWAVRAARHDGGWWSA